MNGPLELSDRARDIFRVVVESYIDSGYPVGSRTISKVPGLDLSPASIRNVMQDLEEMGLLAAPHISAGRVPTEVGLRLFVDGMMQVAVPSAQERDAIEAQIKESGPIEDALAAASMALSGLSACAGMVLVPKGEPIVRQVGFVPLSDRQALAVLVGQDGNVENRVLDLPLGFPMTALQEAANYMNAMLTGMTLGDAGARLMAQITAGEAALNQAAAQLIQQGLAVWSQDGLDNPVLIVRGQANLIDEHAAEDLERVKRLLEELETKRDIARLLDNARVARATRIFIGSENKLFSLSGSSVIAAPWHGKDGRVIGVVGVIGPTRLNYARIIPMVDFTAQTLTRMIA
jgi:heat-inducible transcriptional repressor